MKRGPLVVAGIVVLVLSLASPLATAGEAGKTQLRIDVTGQGHAVGTATFHLIRDLGLGKPDSGTVAYAFSFGAQKTAPNGQFGSSVHGTDTLKGKNGQLVIRSSGRTSSASGYMVWTGTWSIANGTGQYAGLKGGGGFVAVIISSNVRFSFRYEGFVTGS